MDLSLSIALKKNKEYKMMLRIPTVSSSKNPKDVLPM
jgi:hypothetical protein